MIRRFADTFFYLALLNARDAAHEIALNLSRNLSGGFVTTEFVLLELADGMANLSSRQAFVRFSVLLTVDRRLEIVPASTDLLRRGRDLYESRPDTEWSLTDCISFVVMHDRGVTEALTGDRHFEQAGFIAMLK